MLKIHSNKAFVDSRLKLCLSTFVTISLKKFCQLVLVSFLTWPENFIKRIRYKDNHFVEGSIKWKIPDRGPNFWTCIWTGMKVSA